MSSLENTKKYAYPNPANTGTILNLPDSAEDYKLFIYNKFGAMVRSQIITNGYKTYVDLSTMAEGLYILTLVSGTGIISEKLTITK